MIPEGEVERAHVEQDLHSMGCIGLLHRPWTLKNKEMVCEFVSIRKSQMEWRNIFDTTMQDRPKEWTAGVWRAVYQFLSRGSDLANRMDTYVDGKFLHQVDPKNGYPVRDCRDARHRRLLKFIVPIIHLDKPTWVTITIGNTIFGALDGERPVDWGKVFMNLVHKLVRGPGK